jgi:hypothetical protein
MNENCRNAPRENSATQNILGSVYPQQFAGDQGMLLNHERMISDLMTMVGELVRECIRLDKEIKALSPIGENAKKNENADPNSAAKKSEKVLG